MHPVRLGGVRVRGRGERAVAEHPPVAPVLQRDDDRQQRAAPGAEPVAMSRRAFLIGLADEHAVLLEVAQSFGEHLARDGRN
jgi:hypothetical protein